MWDNVPVPQNGFSNRWPDFLAYLFFSQITIKPPLSLPTVLRVSY